jgi:anthranilate synthase component 1
MGSIELTRGGASFPKGVEPGVFGHISWEAIPYLEHIRFTKRAPEGQRISQVHFTLFRYVIAFNPLRNEAYVLTNSVVNDGTASSSLEDFISRAFTGDIRTHPFALDGEEESVQTDEQFIELIATCKKHIARGDVFQIVPSRRYSNRYKGDDFQVYRALRSINPSPYLFYCDYGVYRLFGSSPEAQISLSGGKATIFPLAGTYARTGDDVGDRQKAEKLLEDPKENAEHCMLVDLARNDLSRHCAGVHVERFREPQYFSHLIHLVSKVTGELTHGTSPVQVVCDTFPAGTLSGAPKHRAMRILDENEPHGRGHYGGCVGFLGFNGDAVLGILIRSFLSINQRLIYQVGMGIVHDSIPESEVDEAHTKIRALRLAMQRASELR